MAAFVLLAAVIGQFDFPYYSAPSPPLPSSKVNSTWNTSGFSSNIITGGVQEPIPTSQWWTDLADPTVTETAAVNVLPLLARRVPCGVQIGSPVVTSEQVSRKISTPFTPEITVTVDEVATDDICLSNVDAWDSFRASVKSTRTDVTTPEETLYSFFTRGSPYVNFFPIGDTNMQFQFTTDIDTIARTQISAPVPVMRASLLNIALIDGTRWLITFPKITEVKVDRHHITLLENPNGFVQLSNIPSDQLEHSRTLADNAACSVFSGTVRASVERTDNLTFTNFSWTPILTAPADCKPLMLTAPHHRKAWASGWTANPSALTYKTIYGDLIAAPLSTYWELSHPLLKDPFDKDADPLLLCENYWTHKTLLEDETYLLGEVKADSDNSTGYNSTIVPKAEELYALAIAYRKARRTEALQMGARLRARLYEQLEKIRTLSIYDTTWFGMVASQPGRLLAEPPEDNYEDNQKIYGQILYAFAELYSSPPGAQEDPPKIPEAMSIFASAALQTIMAPFGARYYPPMRNYDWYTSLSYSGGIVTRDEGRVLVNSTYSLLAWIACEKASDVLGYKNASDIAAYLWSAETEAVKSYWLIEGGGVGGAGITTLRRTALEVTVAETLASFSPIGDHLSGLYEELKGIAEEVIDIKNVLALTATPEAVLLDPSLYVGDTFELTLAAIVNGTHVIHLIESGYEMLTTTFIYQPFTAPLEWGWLDAHYDTVNVSCSDLFPFKWPGYIPLQVVGKQLWYKDSFNYYVKSVEYSPAVPGRNPRETNIFEEFYISIFRRDFPLIKQAGFNTLRVMWHSQLSAYGMRDFIKLAGDHDLNIILAFHSSGTEILDQRHKAEELFIDAIDILGKYENIIMWSLESESFAAMQSSESYDFLTLFRQFRRIRDKLDTLKRPISLALAEFAMSQLIEGGTEPVDIYTEGVEIVQLSIMEMNLTNINLLLGQVTHPVYINILTDSFNSINEAQDDFNRSLLLWNMTTTSNNLHAIHEICGVQITEWVDQYWRAEDSDNDHECPDKSPGRHSACSRRVLYFKDGELNMEHQGIAKQDEIWFRHCIEPKSGYFIVAEALTNVTLNSTHFEKSCLFVFLTDFWKWFVIIASICVAAVGVLLFFCASHRRQKVREKAENRGAQAGTRWLQPDIRKLHRIIVRRTCTLPHTSKPFERIALQSEPGLSTETKVAPLSGEWEGTTRWSEDEEQDIVISLQFLANPSGDGGFDISGYDTAKKFRITGTATEFECVGYPDHDEMGRELLGCRYIVQFVAEPIKGEVKGEEADNLVVRFTGLWEKWKSVSYDDDEGEVIMYDEQIIGNDLGNFCCQEIYEGEDQPNLVGEFILTPQPEIDPWCYNRWQCVTMQLQRLQFLIYDEMLCQGRWGTRPHHQETDAGFDHAVQTLHQRYLHSFYGWCQGQRSIGGILDVADENLKKRTDERLTDLLGLFVLWQLGEHMTIFSGHWLSWNMHYFMKFQRFPPTHILNDGRHFMETPLTFDDINESCALTPYYDVPHQCTHRCPPVCEYALEERGLRRQPKLLLPDGNVDTTETDRFPFKKTFREPRKWGVLFNIVHDAFFVIHTTALLFIWWALIVFFSEDTNQRDLNAVIERSAGVWGNSEHMHFILLCCCKLDFWLLFIHEMLDLWISAGLTQVPAFGIAMTKFGDLTSTLCCRCKYCCDLKDKGNTDEREITYHTFLSDFTCMRIRLWSFLKMRWSGYVGMLSFLIILGESLFLTDDHVSNDRIAVHVIIRLACLLIFNFILTIFPVRLHGSPQPEKKLVNRRAIIISTMFWFTIYLVANLFQAWIMYRTESTGFDFCDCEGLNAVDAATDGATEFAVDVWSKIYDCAESQPRCFSAISLIWFSTMCMFAIAIHGGFLIGVMFVGGIKHLLMQWHTRKSRQLLGHKMETRFILSAINVKLLSFTDPRDNNLARKVWNKVIQVMHEEDILSNYEYQTLQIQTHVPDIVFAVANSFARERLSGFLEYLQTSTHYDETLGPVQCYPSVSVVVPVYSESILADLRQLRIKARGDHQQQSQLHFLVEHYRDEWLNFVERAVVENQLFFAVLHMDQVGALLSDQNTLLNEFDHVRKRNVKPDNRLREVCAMRIQELIHTRPMLFKPEEEDAIWWWASYRMQTVARTVRGIERGREASRFLLELEKDYTQSKIINPDYINMICSDKLQLILGLQRMASNKWYDANDISLRSMWTRFPQVKVVFDISTEDFRMSPVVYARVQDKMQGMWDCMEYASCLAEWDALSQDWIVTKVIGRRNPLRMVKNDNVKWALTGGMQGKAVNQGHCLPFCTGQIIQTVDCNQDGYFEESLKLRSLMGKFFPSENRTRSAYKVVGHPEYVITLPSGTVGRYAGYAEYIFNTLFQRVLSVLGVRMHYGHPDYFDSSWVITQSGLSKPNPRVNLNEDIYAGYHIKASNEHVIHIDDIKSGKGRETNFDGAMSFESKLGMGAAMQYRSRDFFELSRYSNVIERHSIFFGAIGMYLYLGLLFVLVYGSILLHIALAFAGKTDYELQKGGSPHGSEWMLQMTFIESAPLGIQLILDYGVWGLAQWLWDMGGVTYFFLFVFLTKYHAFWGSVFNGDAVYVATGRMDPLFKRSFRHMWRMYSHTHFMYGSLLLAFCILYMDIHPRDKWATFLRSFFHWTVALGWMVIPCAFNPSMTVKGISKDILKFMSWIWGDAVLKIKNKKDPLSGIASPKAVAHRKGGNTQALNDLFQLLVKRKRRDQTYEGTGPREGVSQFSGSPRVMRSPNGLQEDGLRESTYTTSSASSTISTESDLDQPGFLINKLNLPEVVESIGSSSGRYSPGGLTRDAVRQNDIEIERQTGLWEKGGGQTFVEYDENSQLEASAKPVVRPGAGFAEQHDVLKDDKAATRAVANTRVKEADDEVLSDASLTEDHLKQRGITNHTIEDLREVFDRLDRTGSGFLAAPDVYKGFMRRALAVELSDITEYLNAMDVDTVSFPEFVLLFHIMEGKKSNLNVVGIQDAIGELPEDKLAEIAERAKARKKTRQGEISNQKDIKTEAFIDIVYAMRRLRHVREIEFYDSTHSRDRLRAECLLHHYKISLILEYSGTSSVGRLLWAFFMAALWCFVYFSLWQDILWEVMYFVFAFTWDYIICLPNVVPIVILSRVLVYMFIFVRLVLMLGVENVFFPTILMVYWFLHVVLHIKFSIWACIGPYVVGRHKFKSRKIDIQREKCLLMLLKDRREPMLFGFAYYFFCRRVLAMFIAGFQLAFCFFILMLRFVIDLVFWLIQNIGTYFARKNATAMSYVASRSRDEEKGDKGQSKGRFNFDMDTQTVNQFNEEKGTQIGISVGPGDDVTSFMLQVPDIPLMAPPAFGNLPGDFDPEQWPVEWLGLAFPDGKPAEWLKGALSGDMAPAEWLKIAFNKPDEELPAEWLAVIPPPDELWPEEPPIDWPQNIPWPPPRPHAPKEKDIDPEWLRLLVSGDDLDPEYLRLGLGNDLPAAEWLRIAAKNKDIPPDWLQLKIPEPGETWQEEPPANWPLAVAPWPPPQPKKKKKEKLPVEWLRLMTDDNEKAKNVQKKLADNEDLLPADLLRLACDDDDLPIDWQHRLPTKKGGNYALQGPKDFPTDKYQWPPPKPSDIPNDLPIDWLKVAFDNKMPDRDIKNIVDDDMEPADWLRIARGDDPPPHWLGIVPPPGGNWPEKAPHDYPPNAPWPPPKPKAYDLEEELPVDWLKLAMQDPTMSHDLLQAAVAGNLDPVEWLKLAYGDDPPPEMLSLIPEHGKDWPLERPDSYPVGAPWPPPKVPEKPVKRPVDEDELEMEWLQLALSNPSLPSHTRQRAIEGDLLPQEWLRLGLGDEDMKPEWLSLGENNGERPADLPVVMPWPLPKRKTKPKDKDIEAEWLALAFDKTNDDKITRKALSGDLTPAEYLRLALDGEDPPPEWLSLGPDGEYPEEMPVGYPAFAPWPPPKPKQDDKDKKEEQLEAEWLRVAFNKNPELAKKAMKNDVEPAEWLRLAMDDQDIRPEWIALDQSGEFPNEPPVGYPVGMPWPPPAASKKVKGNKEKNDAEAELQVEWLNLALSKPDLLPEDRKNISNHNMQPADWLRIALDGEEPPPEWLVVGPTGEFPEKRPKNYPENLPWPPPKAQQDPEQQLDIEWLSLAFDKKGYNSDIAKKAVTGDLTPAEWLKLGLDNDDDLNPDWLSLDQTGQYPAERPIDLPLVIPWPPPMAKKSKERTEQDELKAEWITFAEDKGLTPEQIKNLDDLPAAEWLRLALDDDGDDVPPEWLDVTGPRPANYPADAPWPVPKTALQVQQEEELKATWLKLCFDNNCDLETTKKVMNNTLPPADYLKIALNGEEIPPNMLSIGQDGKYPKKRPKGYPKNAPWPPPQRAPQTAEEELKIEWLQLALNDPKIAPSEKKRAADGDLLPAEWIKLAIGGEEPPIEWLAVDDNGNWPKERPAGYPATAPWPPPKVSKKKQEEELHAEWLKLALTKDLDDHTIKRLKDEDVPPAEWLQIALGGDPPPAEWLTLAPNGEFPKERPAGYPASFPWPPPKAKQKDREEELHVEWLTLCFNKKPSPPPDVLARAKNKELEPEEWLKIALDGKQPPDHWLKKDKSGDFPTRRPEDYPRNLPWAMPKKREETQILVTPPPVDDRQSLKEKWIKVALDKKVDPQVLKKARNDELPTTEWLKIALNGEEPPIEWLNLQGSDGTWPKEPPADYPATLPWPPLGQAGRRPSGAPPRKRSRAVSIAKATETKAAVTLGFDDTGDNQEVPVEWLRLAFDTDSKDTQQAALHGDLPTSEWLKIASGLDEIPAEWLQLTPQEGQDWPENPPAGYPIGAPWPPPKPKPKSQFLNVPGAPGGPIPKKRHRGHSVAARSQPQVAVKLEEDGPLSATDKGVELPAEWLKLALNPADDTSTQIEAGKVKQVLDNDLPSEEWLRVANGGKAPPKEWLECIPPPGEDWPPQPPLGFPDGVPWPPPKPKSRPQFECGVWEEQPDDVVFGTMMNIPPVPNVESQGQEQHANVHQATFNLASLTQLQDNLKDKKDLDVQEPEATKRREIVYFKESGDPDKVHFADADDFHSVADFRAKVRHFFKFKGPVDQVLIQIEKQTDFTDMIEVENTHAWPLPSSQSAPIIITIFELFQSRQRKQRMKVRGNQLRVQPTVINRRAAAMRNSKDKSSIEPLQSKFTAVSLLQPGFGPNSKKSGSSKPSSPANTAMTPTLPGGAGGEVTPLMPPSASPVVKPIGKPAEVGPPVIPGVGAKRERRYSVTVRPTLSPPTDVDSESNMTFADDGPLSPAERQRIPPVIGLSFDATKLRKQETFRGTKLPNMSEPAGLKVLTAGSPAAEAGIKAGDVVRTVNGKPVATEDELKAVLLKTKKDVHGGYQPLSIVVDRAGGAGKATFSVRPLQGSAEAPTVVPGAGFGGLSRVQSNRKGNQLPFADMTTVGAGSSFNNVSVNRSKATQSLTNLASSLRRQSTSSITRPPPTTDGSNTLAPPAQTRERKVSIIGAMALPGVRVPQPMTLPPGSPKAENPKQFAE
eukprot:TRINITY_DN5744_c0_g1_i1.p1 TRINITY_DN5744_c0_g1~~TRINITY_DN5744_c0_g1_i1.p1  ORF type:complete len:5506 (+),score=1153.77 TRINITY_DN5744_c0_g1_i1:113-16630(+)